MKTTRRFVRHSPAHRQRGGITLLLIMVLIVLAALVGVLAVRGATSDLQMASSQRLSRTGFYCAEAALNAGRAIVGQHVGDWNTILANGNPSWPSWYPSAAGIPIDVDGDDPSLANPDAYVVLSDDQDGDGNTQHDKNLSVILTATCVSKTLESTNATRSLSQIITYAGNGGHDYKYQAGHSSTHSGNENSDVSQH